MIKDVLRQLDYSTTAQISLLMFFVIFLLVTIRTLTQNRQSCHEQANVIFDDQIKESHNE